MSAITFDEVLDRLGLVVQEENDILWQQRIAEVERRAAEQELKERRVAEQERREKEQQRQITAKRMLERGFGSDDIAFLLDIPAEQIDEFLANVKASK